MDNIVSGIYIKNKYVFFVSEWSTKFSLFDARECEVWTWIFDRAMQICAFPQGKHNTPVPHYTEDISLAIDVTEWHLFQG